MNRTVLARSATAAVGGLLLLGGLALPAAAKDGDVRVTGTCSAGARTKLKLGPRDGRIEAELEVDSDRTGQTWTVTMAQNGTEVFRGNRATAGPSGSFEVRRVLPNRAGRDTFRAVATDLRSRQRCTVTASL